MSTPTQQQQKAIEGSGGILLSAGAGTGKTATLVNRCIRLVTESGVDIDRILMVTFTNAAAAEMRQRIREALQKKLEADPGNNRLLRQVSLLESSYISTIHSFCVDLIRSHFELLNLDPAVAVLDEAVTAPLARETVGQIVGEAIGNYPAVRKLAENYCSARGEKLGELVLRAQRFFVTQPQSDSLMGKQRAFFESKDCAQWKGWREEFIAAWLAESRPLILEQASTTRGQLKNVKGYGGKSATAQGIRTLEEVIDRVVSQVAKLSPSTSKEESAAIFSQIQVLAQEDLWVRGTGKTMGVFEDLFEEVKALAGWQIVGENDPLDADWELVREPMLALIHLTQQFAAAFAQAKRAIGGVDFSDLEQFALQLLTDEVGQPTDIARQWQDRLEHVFVDECQDINAAQDAIMRAVSRTAEKANLFMVGDVKQSIYRFRLAAPELFRNYARDWNGKPHHRVLPLTENFRSREGIINFVNELFGHLMQTELGGVTYASDDQLQFGKPVQGDRSALSLLRAASGANSGFPGIWSEPHCRVELHLIDNRKEDESEGEIVGDSGSKNSLGWLDLLNVEQQARVVATRLRELKDGKHEVWDKSQNQFREMKWSDVGILMRSVASRTGPYVCEFRRLGIPLSVEQGNYLETVEASDLISLLRLLDNPQQDIPLFAVLRSPLVGLSMDELVQLRPEKTGESVWEHLAAHPSGPLKSKIDAFLMRYEKWRRLALMTSLSCVLETALVETGYEPYLLTLEDGPARLANVRRFLELAQRYDPLQRQGLFRFLKFIDAQAEAENEIEPVPPRQAESAQLLTIHRSKGLEFPIVVVASIGAKFNQTDLNENILFSRRWGICPQVIDAEKRLRCDSLTGWQTRREEKLEGIAEELRLLYVAVTRARDTLLLVGSFNPEKQIKENYPASCRIAKVSSYCDWIRIWLGPAINWSAGQGKFDFSNGNGCLRWEVHGQPPEGSDELKKNVMTTAMNLPVLTEDQMRQFDWEYPQAAATVASAKTSATVLKRLAAESDEEASQPWRTNLAFEVAAADSAGKLNATQRGLAHHAFLQDVQLTQTGSKIQLESEARRMVAAGQLKPNEADALDLDAILKFWTSEVGTVIAGNVTECRRELQFTAAFKPSELKSIFGASMDAADDEFVVIQGAADLVLIRPTEIWLVDFKTDRFEAEELQLKLAQYAPQLNLYAAALQRIYRKPVTRRILYFLNHPGLREVAPLGHSLTN